MYCSCQSLIIRYIFFKINPSRQCFCFFNFIKDSFIIVKLFLSNTASFKERSDLCVLLFRGFCQQLYCLLSSLSSFFLYSDFIFLHNFCKSLIMFYFPFLFLSVSSLLTCFIHPYLQFSIFFFFCKSGNLLRIFYILLEKNKPTYKVSQPQFRFLALCLISSSMNYSNLLLTHLRF